MSQYAAKHAAPSGRSSQRKHQTKQKAPHRGARRLAVGLGIAVALGGAAYGAGCYYFQDHFLPNTTVNGRNVSLKSESEVASDISSSTDGYASTVRAGDFSCTVAASDIDLKTDGDTAARDALSQQDVAAWPYLALKGSNLEVQQGISYDEQKLSDAVGAAVDAYNAQAQQPEDATWTYDEESGQYQIKPEQPGDVVSRDAVVSSALSGVGSLSETTTCGDSAKVAPARTSGDEALQAAVRQANAMLSESIPLTYQGKVKATVGHDQLAKWVSIGDDLSVSVDRDAVASYVSGTVSKAVDTEDEENSYTVAKGSLAGKIAESVESGSGGSVEIPVKTTPKPKRQADESDAKGSGSSKQDGDGASGAAKGSYDASLGSYIDVNLSSQKATYYSGSGSVLWSSSIVSGNSSEGRSTPTGTYQINSKATDQTLVGSDEDGDGEPDYKSHVSYWMPFIGNSVGLHDATWRGSFGGSIYESNGSHGCVNLPYGKAQELYGMVPVGTTVRVHY